MNVNLLPRRAVASFIILTICAMSICAQEHADSTRNGDDGQYRFRWPQLALPTALIAAGAIGTANGNIRHMMRDLRQELMEETDGPNTIDNILQYAPLVSVWGLKACGLRGGRSDWRGLTVVTATSVALMAAAVQTVKHLVKVERPDGTNTHSFPSGHTATAFLGAELLRIEYGQRWPWIAVGGYAIATGVACLRVYNNRHWPTDLLAGAGIGILSVRAAYWLYPLISKVLWPNKGHNSKEKHQAQAISIVPAVAPGYAGVALAWQL